MPPPANEVAPQSYLLAAARCAYAILYMAFTSSQFSKLLSHLPFPLDATDRVNAAFERWQSGASTEAKRIVDLWSYCYVFRYFLLKSTKGDLQEASDFDALAAKAYRRVIEGRSAVRDSDRYASWVSVICRNALINYAQRQPSKQSIDEEDGPTLIADSPSTPYDLGFTHRLLTDAVDRLPPYLQDVARLYFFEDCDYEEISARLNKPVPTVRSYKHKLIRKMREDPQVAAFLDELGQAPGN